MPLLTENLGSDGLLYPVPPIPEHVLQREVRWFLAAGCECDTTADDDDAYDESGWYLSCGCMDSPQDDAVYQLALIVVRQLAPMLGVDWYGELETREELDAFEKAKSIVAALIATRMILPTDFEHDPTSNTDVRRITENS